MDYTNNIFSLSTKASDQTSAKITSWISNRAVRTTPVRLMRTGQYFSGFGRRSQAKNNNPVSVPLV
jgi:hypothetical protein